jgi:metal-responsive CopG/Arc/MetJ family transcriptional regulator
MAEEKKQIAVKFPNELAEEIDALVGPRKRNTFIAQAAEQELRRRKQAAFTAEQFEVHEPSGRIWLN